MDRQDEDETGQKVYKSLGFCTDAFDYEKAREAAEAWFRLRDAGVADELITVTDACKAYVEHLRREKGDVSAHDADMRFKRTVYGTTFGAISVGKLRTPPNQGMAGRSRMSKGSSNRTLTALKAALNLAVTNRRVLPALAREWGDVKQHKDATKRRTLFLDLRQRRRLFERANGALRDLIEAVALTGARAGELTKATRGQFDARLGNITFKGKTGTRTIPVSKPALELFSVWPKGKLPAAPLFTRDDGKPGPTATGTNSYVLRRKLQSSRQEPASTRCATASSRRQLRTDSRLLMLRDCAGPACQ